MIRAEWTLALFLGALLVFGAGVWYGGRVIVEGYRGVGCLPGQAAVDSRRLP